MSDPKTWEQRVAAWRASGQSAREFAEGRDLSVHMLRYWAKRVEKEAVAPGPDTAVRVARVVVTASEPSLAPSTTPQPSAAGGAPATLVLELGGARVQIPAGFERATLRAVLEVLRESEAR